MCRLMIHHDRLPSYLATKPRSQLIALACSVRGRLTYPQLASAITLYTLRTVKNVRR